MAACDWHTILSLFISNHVVPCSSVNSQPAQQVIMAEEPANNGRISPAHNHNVRTRKQSLQVAMERKSTWAHNSDVGLKAWIALHYSSPARGLSWTALRLTFSKANGVQHEPGGQGGGPLREAAGEAEDGDLHRGDHSGRDHRRRRQRRGTRGKWEFQLSTVLPLHLFYMQSKTIYK